MGIMVQTWMTATTASLKNTLAITVRFVTASPFLHYSNSTAMQQQVRQNEDQRRDGDVDLGQEAFSNE